MKVAAAQISCALGDVAANVRKMRDYAAGARNSGAELIVFPEASDTGYSMSTIPQHASEWNDGAVSELQKIAKEFSIAIIAGVSEREGGSIYNSQAFIDSTGAIAARYRKTHLFAAEPGDESKCFTPGNALTSHKIGNLHFGLTICYDLRFPEIYRALVVDHQVNVFVNSSAWPLARAEHLRILALARAIENQSYMILANRAGHDDGVTHCGSSAIIDPYGVTLASASTDREEILYGEISREAVDLVRERIPVFKHRRTDLY